ncbi:MAG: hypothetical protein JSR67_09235 [Proteobacteria bacterium]|nr:hypothetical protein [Pseudomonadota bacterium]
MFFAAVLGAPQLAGAGPFADDMARCLVNSTSAADRTVLVKWIFGVITLHPDLAAMSNVTPRQRDDISSAAGTLFQKLLLDSCRSQTQQALQNEGLQTIQYAFQVLGQAATRGLFTDPQVMQGAKDLGKYVSEEKLKALINAPAQTPAQPPPQTPPQK